MLRRRLLLVWLAYLACITACTYYLLSYDSDEHSAATASILAPGASHDAAQQCSAASMTPGATALTAGLDVWVVAGQSNAVGDNWRDTSPLPEASAAAADASILSFGPEHRWAPAQPNIHFGIHNYTQRDSVGPDMSFARFLIAEGLSPRVGLIPTAKCNTDLATDWQPPAGPFYTHMLDTIHAAFRALPQAEPQQQARLMGMIWVQGESDAIAAPAAGPSKAETYIGNLINFITSVRISLAPYHPCLPIILALVSEKQASAKLPNMHSIRQHQLALQLPAIIKVDMDRHEFYAQAGGITLHLSKQGQSSFGREMAQAYKAWRLAPQ